MERLIDANELKAWFLRPYSNEEAYSNIDICSRIDSAPTVDPVNHGHWEHGKELSRDYIGDACVDVHYDKWWCSECNYPFEKKPLWNYCPNCGAKMTLD